VVNVRICSKYNKIIVLDDTVPSIWYNSPSFTFYIPNHTSNQSKKSGVKYERINVHPVGQV